MPKIGNWLHGDIMSFVRPPSTHVMIAQMSSLFLLVLRRGFSRPRSLRYPCRTFLQRSTTVTMTWHIPCLKLLKGLSLTDSEFTKYPNHEKWTFCHVIFGAEQCFPFKSVQNDQDHWNMIRIIGKYGITMNSLFDPLKKLRCLSLYLLVCPFPRFWTTSTVNYANV